MKIIGIEDLRLYFTSVRSYAELAKRRDEILAYLSIIRKASDKLKTFVYPAEILTYHNEVHRLLMHSVEIADRITLRVLHREDKLGALTRSNLLRRGGELRAESRLRFLRL